MTDQQAASYPGAAECTISTDECEVECPACGAMSNLQDFRTDGCLKGGMDYECDACAAKLVIAAVD